MPELPEVESLARKLGRELRGETIRKVEVHWGRSIATPTPRTFVSKLLEARISRVFRRAKYLVFELNQGKTTLHLLCHLRMSGSFRFGKAGELQKHDRVEFVLKTRTLYFSDIRKFGKMYLVKSHEQITKSLGIEPFNAEFNGENLHLILSTKRGAVKPLLLNQRIVAGIGNIYADESLWRAKIHPLRTGDSLSLSDCRALVRSIRTILSEAINSSGTDFGDNVVCDGEYRPRVYGRAGQNCKRCKTPISRTVIGQRGTSFCSVCQV